MKIKRATTCLYFDGFRIRIGGIQPGIDSRVSRLTILILVPSNILTGHYWTKALNFMYVFHTSLDYTKSILMRHLFLLKLATEPKWHKRQQL